MWQYNSNYIAESCEKNGYYTIFIKTIYTKLILYIAFDMEWLLPQWYNCCDLQFHLLFLPHRIITFPFAINIILNWNYTQYILTLDKTYLIEQYDYFLMEFDSVVYLFISVVFKISYLIFAVLESLEASTFFVQ